MDSQRVQGTNASGPPHASRISPLRHRAMRILLSTEIISSLGSQMTYITLPWFVLITTGSATRMSLVFAAEIAPVAIFGISSGQVVQRLGVRRTMLLADGIRAPLIASVPLMYYFGILSYGLLLAVVFCAGIFTTPYPAAQRLLIPEALGVDEALVVQGNALVEGATRAASFFGPALAGLLISIIRPANVIWIDAATYAISFAILATGLRTTSTEQRTTEDRSGLLDGARFVLRDSLLRRVCLAALLFGLFFPVLIASLPVAAKVRYDADSFTAGLLFAAFGLGGLAGAFLAMRAARKVSPIRMGAFAAVALTIPTWLFWLPLEAWAFCILLLVTGLFMPMLNSPLMTIILLRAPNQLRAKVITFVVTTSVLTSPLGYVVAGPALVAWGLGPVLVIVAAGLSVAALLLMTLLRIQDLPDATD
jgi:MFS family permease